MSLFARSSKNLPSLIRLRTNVRPRSWNLATTTSTSFASHCSSSFPSSSKQAVGDRSRLRSTVHALTPPWRGEKVLLPARGIGNTGWRPTSATRTFSKHVAGSDIEALNKELDEFFGTPSDGRSPTTPAFADPAPFPLSAEPQLPRASDTDPPSTAATRGRPPTSQLSHVDSQGKVKMVDTSGKEETSRVAWAAARVILGEEAFSLVQQSKIAKGDVLTVARIAGINGAKMTSNVIPLCHNVPLSGVTVELSLHAATNSVEIVTSATTRAATGVEMEALTAASVAALTVYDMCKAVTKGIEIADVRLLAKSGGKSGTWVREGDRGASLLGGETAGGSRNESLILQEDSSWTSSLPHAR